MNNQNNCTKYREDIAAFVLGLLEPKDAEKLKKHLETCQNCKVLYQSMLNEEKDIRISFNEVAQKGKIIQNSFIEKLDKNEQVTLYSPKVIKMNWGKFLKSPLIKFAAAAVLVVAVLLIFNNGSVITTPAFGLVDVIEAINNAKWMHIKYEITEIESFDPNEVIRLPEIWYSVNPYRIVQTFGDGNISFREDELGIVTDYDLESNKITITYKSENSVEHPSSIENLLFDQISDVEKEGGKVTYSEDFLEDKPVTVMDVDTSNVSDNGLHLSLFVDPKTRLPKKVVLKKIDGQNAVITGIIDYPENGPSDIYELGVPRNAEIVIVDTRDLPELINALKPYNKAREKFVSDYILITTYQYGSSVRSVEIIYNQGKKQRGEYRPVWGSVINDEDLIAYKEALGDSFESLLKWSQGYENSMGKNLGIDIYDGKYFYRVSKDPTDEWTIHEKEYYPNHNPVGLYDLCERAWPSILPRNNITLIENDFSREASLLAFERISEPAVREGKLVQPAEKVIYYLDPYHDYMCVREENFSHSIRGYIDIKEVNFNINEIPEEISSYLQVSEFGQTDIGQWYPKKIESYSKNGNEQPLRLSLIMTLYLKTNPEFPEGIFDPNNLPK